MRLLLAEDDPEFANALMEALSKEGFDVDWSCNLSALDAMASACRYRVILLDRRLPDGDGASMLGRIRELQADVPIILVTAMHEVSDRIEGLDAGADDYLSKPFEMTELMARIRAVCRRPGSAPLSMTLGRLSYDFESRQAYLDGQQLKLPRRQILVLEALCLKQGRTLRRTALESYVYGVNEHVESNAIESHISRLRSALKDSGVEIHTLRGIGYMLKQALPLPQR